MRKLLLSFLLFFISVICFSQIVSLNNDKVTVRDVKGNFIASSYFSDLQDVDGGKDIVVLWYDNNKIEVRDYKLRFKTSRYFSNLKNVKASENNVVLYYNNGKIEIRDEDLDFISSHY